jgi:hypothetical protein
MFSPVNYASPQLFALLTHDFRQGLAKAAASAAAAGEASEAGEAVEASEAAPTTAGVRDSLAWLAPPPADEVAAFEAARQEPGWPPQKRLRVALFHFVYW